MDDIRHMSRNIVLGPVTKDAFDQAKWEEVRHHISLLNSATTDKDIILPHCKLFLQFLNDLNSCLDYDEYFQDCTIKQFFFNKFLTINAKNIINSKHPRSNQELEGVLDACLQQSIFFWIRVIPDDYLNLTKMAKDILDPSCKYYAATSSRNLSKLRIETKDISSDDRKDPKVIDPLASSCSKTVYAMKKLNHHYTNTFIDLVNHFGRNGGFEKIYQRILDRNSWVSLKIMTMLCCIVSNLCHVLSQEFIHDFIPRFSHAICDNLLENPQIKLEGLTKSKFSKIMESLDKSVRLATIEARNLDLFALRICEILIESENHENQIQGLYILFRLIRNAGSKSIFKESLQNNDIFNKIYSPKTNPEVIKRSEYLLRYLLQQQMLTMKDLKKLWNLALTQGFIFSKVICKILSKSIENLEPEYLEFLMSCLLMIPDENLIEEHVTLVFGLSNFLADSALFCKGALQFCWKIISNDNGIFSPSMIKLVLDKFWTMIKQKSFKVYDAEIICSFIENIKKQILVLNSIKTMKILIKKYPSFSSPNYSFTIDTLFEHLCRQKDLHNVLMEELKSFKHSVQEKVQDKTIISEEVLDSCLGSGRSYKKEISKRVSFYRFVMTRTYPKKLLSTYDVISDVWDTLVLNSLFPLERSVGTELVRIGSNSIRYLALNEESMQKFFREKMSPGGLLSAKTLTEEGFQCFMSVFLNVNPKLNKIFRKFNLKLDASEIIGIESIWCFIWDADDYNVSKNAFWFYCDVYCHINTDFAALKEKKFKENCIEGFRKVLENQRTNSKSTFLRECLRCLNLTNLFIDESEKQGIGDLTIHCPPRKVKSVTLYLEFDDYLTRKIPESLREAVKSIEIKSTARLHDLLVEIARIVKFTWEQINLIRNIALREISSYDLGKTLEEIGLKDGELLRVKKRFILEEYLLEESGVFKPVTENIFREWFRNYSDDGKMSPEQCAVFIRSCTNEDCEPNDHRVLELFQKYDTYRDSYLREDEFVKVYLDAYKSRRNLVIANLNSHGYRNDLQKISELKYEKVDQTSLLRYIISHNDDYFQLIFSLLQLDNEEIAHEAWKMLRRMPTNPRMFCDVVMLKGVRNSTENPKWNELLDPRSNYKLLYLLYIVENLLNEKITEKETEQMLSSPDPKVYEYKSKWRYDFATYGGVEHILNIIDVLITRESTNLSVCDRGILSSILRILQKSFGNTSEAPSSNLIDDAKALFVKILPKLISFLANDEPTNQILKLEEKKKFNMLVSAILRERDLSTFSIINLCDFIDEIVEILEEFKEIPNKKIPLS